MLATAHVKFDRKYFELQYDEWIRHRSRYKKYEIWFALVLILCGVTFALIFRQQWLAGVLFASAGIYEFAMAATHKCRWVNARASQVRDDKSVDLTFDSKSLKSASDNGSSEILIAGFTGFTQGTNGFFLIPATGVSIYIPRASINPSDSYSDLIEMLSSTVGPAR